MTGVLRARVGGAWVDVVGSGSDEVVISPDDPIATYPGTELWYDTDDDYTNALTPTAVAGNALGIVAMGAPVASVALVANTMTQVTANLPYTTLVGRRYRFTYAVRAMAIAAGVGAVNVWLRDSSTQLPNNAGPWFNTTVNNGGGYWQWVLDGDGVARTWNIAAQSGSATTLYNEGQSLFYIEDMGPNQAPALPVPTTYQSWTQVTTFSNSWVNYGAPYPPAMYRRVGDIVDVRGLIKAGTVNASGGCFTLPAGFRPAWQQWFPTSAFDAFGQTIVYASGEVRPSIGNNTWFDLGTISFSVTG